MNAGNGRSDPEPARPRPARAFRLRNGLIASWTIDGGHTAWGNQGLVEAG